MKLNVNWYMYSRNQFAMLSLILIFFLSEKFIYILPSSEISLLDIFPKETLLWDRYENVFFFTVLLW